MRVDVHVHTSAMTMPRGSMSRRLLDSAPFRFMRWHLGVQGEGPGADAQIERALLGDLDGTPELDAAVVLAFDAVHDRDTGRRDEARTHLYVSNDAVIDLARRHPKVRFGASVHPYRRDAIAELERCVAAGAVLVKWLPITQDIDPTDARCLAFYDALAHHGLPLLSHTGAEHALPNLAAWTADPMLLRPALDRGVTVVMAHCGSREFPWEPDHVGAFVRLANAYERCYGDTAALSLPGRWHALSRVLSDRVAQTKLLHGSDWPIPPIAPPHLVGLRETLVLQRERNWLRRDARIKGAIDGLDADYWTRAARVLRLR